MPSGSDYANEAYKMAVESTGENDNQTPKYVYPKKGLTPVLGEMDCQGFVEAVLVLVGVKKDWTGSNAIWRNLAWKGTPEECKAKYGKIPAGALLFIWTDDW